MISQSLKLLLFYTSMENLFVAEEEEEISLGMQMYNFHRWYPRMSKKEIRMFGVKYQDFFRGEGDFCVDFEVMHAMYHRQALDASIITNLVFVSIMNLNINTFC